MQVKKTITLSKEEIHKILSKFVEKKVKNPVVLVTEATDGSLDFTIAPSIFDETGE
jgi:hypothetical protein